MKSEFVGFLRLEQTRHQLELVSTNLNKELKEIVDLDKLGLHKTQLGLIKTVFEVATQELQTHLGEIKPTAVDLEDIYDNCRDFDEAIIWMQRLWDYLKEKLQQRNEQLNKELANLLKSADEVVWSCFHGVLQNALGEHGPAPLTYIEPEYSPATIQTDKPLPVNLMLKGELDFLDECLQSLPIPVLRLPPNCISSPWWLVFVAHEVGHHVQYALDLVGYFRVGMSQAATSQGYSTQEAAASWGNWGEEIFADFFSLLMMGDAALRAIAEIEIGAPAKMVRRKPNYPAPVIRLALMKRVADRLGLDTQQTLLNFELEQIAAGDQVCKKDFGVIEAAVEFALAELPGGRGKLNELCGFDANVFKNGGPISDWAARLNSKGNLQIDRQTALRLETARHIASASLQAWAKHSMGTELGDQEANSLERSSRRETIRARTIEGLLQSGPRETRFGAPGDESGEKLGKNLADLLRKRLSNKTQ